uniref:Uncharacterized protein n=1 Tax=Branchiostoma floridae TaxID=7739 RepID=C3ZA40_BRAFL|eukprot:XP_002594617.1 hypothetical protein BRAFLDRAFT_77586 [Branchiostoma floridae]
MELDKFFKSKMFQIASVDLMYSHSSLQDWMGIISSDPDWTWITAPRAEIRVEKGTVIRTFFHKLQHHNSSHTCNFQHSPVQRKPLKFTPPPLKTCWYRPVMNTLKTNMITAETDTTANGPPRGFKGAKTIVADRSGAFATAVPDSSLFSCQKNPITNARRDFTGRLSWFQLKEREQKWPPVTQLRRFDGEQPTTEVNQRSETPASLQKHPLTRITLALVFKANILTSVQYSRISDGGSWHFSRCLSHQPHLPANAPGPSCTCRRNQRFYTESPHCSCMCDKTAILFYTSSYSMGTDMMGTSTSPDTTQELSNTGDCLCSLQGNVQGAQGNSPPPGVSLQQT